MKKTIQALVILLFFCVAQAAPVPKADLKKVNDFIKVLFQAEGEEDFSMKLTHVDKTEGEIRAIRAEISATDESDGVETAGYMDLKLLSDDLITLKAGITIGPEGDDEEETKESFDMLYSMIGWYAESINKKGDYKVVMKRKNRKNGSIKVTATFKPVSKEAKSVKFLKLTANYKPSKDGATISAKLKGRFHADSDLISRGRLHATAIFNSLLNEIEPSDKNMDGLGEVIDEVLEYIMPEGLME